MTYVCTVVQLRQSKGNERLLKGRDSRDVRIMSMRGHADMSTRFVLVLIMTMMMDIPAS